MCSIRIWCEEKTLIENKNRANVEEAAWEWAKWNETEKEQNQAHWMLQCIAYEGMKSIIAFAWHSKENRVLFLSL